MATAGHRRPVGVTRELERATDVAWTSLKMHGARCQVCEPDTVNSCALGRVLLRHWCALREMMEEPSRLGELHVLGT